jgi:hypothetical protein
LFSALKNDATNKLESTYCLPSDHTICRDTPEAQSLRQTASNNGTMSAVALAVGATAIAVGAVWWWFERQTPAKPNVAQVRVTPIREGVLVGLSGAF